jgi:hypothetical protein
MIQESIMPAIATGTYKMSFAEASFWENISNKTVNILAKEEIKIRRKQKGRCHHLFSPIFLFQV